MNYRCKTCGFVFAQRHCFVDGSLVMPSCDEAERIVCDCGHSLFSEGANAKNKDGDTIFEEERYDIFEEERDHDYRTQPH